MELKADSANNGRKNMYKEKLRLGIKSSIVEIQYKSLDKKLNSALLNIIENIEKKLDNKKGQFFIGNFETCP